MANELKDFRTLDLISQESSKRSIRSRKLDIVAYDPSPRSKVPLALEGTVTLLVAHPGSPLMAEIRTLLANQSDTDEVAKKLYSQYKKRTRVTLAKAVKTVVSQHVFAEVLHGEITLQEGLFVPEGLEVACLPFAYNGGALVETGLTLVEHPASDDAESLDVIALMRAPRLSAAERAALGKVPVEQVALNLGAGPGARACGTVLLTALVVAEVAVVVVTFTITGAVSQRHMESLTAAEIKKLGPSATARTLVAMRRKLLTTKPVREPRS